MKNIKTFILAAAAVVALPMAPEAAAKKARASTYACVKNDSGFLAIKMRISYRTVRGDGSIHWKRSPWSKTAAVTQTTCISMGRAPVGHNVYVEAKEAAFFWSKTASCKAGGSTGAVFRHTDRRNASPKHAVFSYRTKKNLFNACDRGPYTWDSCKNCIYKDW